MTTEKTSLDALLATREQLIAAIHSRLDEAAKNFLLSFHHLKPTWELLNLPGIENLPAVRWKLANLEIMQNKQPEKYQTMMRDLESVLAKKESAPHE
ncbi:MAG: hypothetical protein QOE55_2612 [Acidobacteriaceae bacterium]|nr:hypothetical protein [Acidobacteriaceae bacterium]